MKREALDIREKRPPEMDAYLDNYGWHFNKKMCEFAISKMKRINPATGKSEKIEPYTKEQLDSLFSTHGIRLENNVLYDYVFVANMCKADYYKSSVPDDAHLVLFVKDYIDDSDAPDGVAMRRWYATMVGLGEPIEWSDMI